MKTFLTILTAVVIAVGVTQLIRYHERKPDSAGNGGPGQNFVHCGLDSKGHIVPDGRGGCIPPPPTGYIIDVPIPEGAVIEKYPVKHAVPTEESLNGLVRGKLLSPKPARASSSYRAVSRASANRSTSAWAAKSHERSSVRLRENEDIRAPYGSYPGGGKKRIQTLSFATR